MYLVDALHTIVLVIITIATKVKCDIQLGSQETCFSEHFIKTIVYSLIICNVTLCYLIPETHFQLARISELC